MAKEDRILEQLQKMEITQAVMIEKLSTMNTRLDAAAKEFEAVEKEVDKLEKRIDKHDKIVGGIVIAFTILTALIKLKII